MSNKKYEAYNNPLHYIEDSQVFKAVSFVRSMLKKGEPIGIAIHIAAKHYKVDKHEVAKEFGKHAAKCKYEYWYYRHNCGEIKDNMLKDNIKNDNKLINAFSELEYILSSALLKEIREKDGSINSWLKKIPGTVLDKYLAAQENLKKKQSLLDSKDLTDKEKEDIFTTINLLVNIKNNFKGMPISETYENIRKLITRMAPISICNKVFKDSGGAVKDFLLFEDDGDPWGLLSGSIRVNPLYKDVSTVERK